jgi:hypothetical protein
MSAIPTCQKQLLLNEEDSRKQFVCDLFLDPEEKNLSIKASFRKNLTL